MHHYARHIGDYAKDTKGLSLMQHGAYTLLLDQYYASENPLSPDRDVLYRICGAFKRGEKDAVDSVLEQFFTFDETRQGWLHQRCEREIAIYQSRSDAGKKGMSARWRDNKQDNKTPNTPDNKPITNAIATNNHKPLTNNQEPDNAPKAPSQGASDPGLASLSDPASAGQSTTPKAYREADLAPQKKKREAADQPEFPQKCQAIYEAYPRHVARPHALRKITAALRLERFEDLLAKTKAYAAAVANEDPQFIPHPATWFGQQRYNDDPATWTRSHKKETNASYTPQNVLQALPAAESPPEFWEIAWADLFGSAPRPPSWNAVHDSLKLQLRDHSHQLCA